MQRDSSRVNLHSNLVKSYGVAFHSACDPKWLFNSVEQSHRPSLDSMLSAFFSEGDNKESILFVKLYSKYVIMKIIFLKANVSYT